MLNHQQKATVGIYISGTILVLIGMVNCNPNISQSKFSKHDLKGFPQQIQKKAPDSSDPKEFLLTIAEDTWEYFRNAIDCRTGLVVDKIWLSPDEIADYTSITNIGLQMLATISAMDFGFIDSSEAECRVKVVLQTLNKLPRYNGFFYNWYNLRTKKASRRYISSVDAGWLYSSLAIVMTTFPNLAEICASLINQADFGWLYDNSLHHFYLGFDTEQECYTPYHYGLLCSESRICLYWGILQGAIPPEDWFYQERTINQDFKQAQIPQGAYTEKFGISYFKGYYTYDDISIVPSWGGAMFEFLMPGLLINERKLAPQGIGENNRRAVQIHIDYALNKLGYLIWGMSPSTNPARGYAEYGVPLIGSKVDGYSPTIISPHASILALPYAPQAVIENLKMMLSKYPVYGEYGFYDSIDPHTGEVGRAYLALDQSMVLISLNNYLNDNAITDRFEQLVSFAKISELLTEDDLF